MAKYRKKPLVVEALLWSGNNPGEVKQFIGRAWTWKVIGGQVRIATPEGNMFANTGDYIIKGVKGEFYPCKPDVFAETYERVEA